MGKLKEVETLRVALESANECCRSMAAIAHRHGRGATNWEAFRDQLRESLLLQHAALHPETAVVTRDRPHKLPFVAAKAWLADDGEG